MRQPACAFITGCAIIIALSQREQDKDKDLVAAGQRQFSTEE
jgi:hypothetical protein